MPLYRMTKENDDQRSPDETRERLERVCDAPSASRRNRMGRTLERRRQSNARHLSVETMPNASVIPVIDLGPYLAGEPGALDRAAAELRHALTEIGFYSIVNHGVPSMLVHEVYRQVARFHAQPLDEKLKISSISTMSAICK